MSEFDFKTSTLEIREFLEELGFDNKDLNNYTAKEFHIPGTEDSIMMYVNLESYKTFIYKNYTKMFQGLPVSKETNTVIDFIKDRLQYVKNIIQEEQLRILKNEFFE